MRHEKENLNQPSDFSFYSFWGVVIILLAAFWYGVFRLIFG